MKAFFYPLLLAVLLSGTAASAQQANKEGSATPPQLTRQFQNLKSSSNSYVENQRQYKVINVQALDTFWESVEKAILATRQGLINGQESAEKELAKAQATISEQQQQLEALKQENARKEAEVQQSLHAVNNLSVLGIGIHKQVYVILTAVIILALAIALAVVVLMHKGSKKVAVEKKKAFEAMELELNECKKNAREREIRIKRELQTEMNRIEELNQEIARLQKSHA